MTAPISRMLLPAQVCLVLCGFATLLLLPPPEGRMWLVPVTAAGRAGVSRLALAGGARLVAEGPVAGTLVVLGARARLWRPMLAAGVLVIASPGAGCGTDPLKPAAPDGAAA